MSGLDAEHERLLQAGWRLCEDGWVLQKGTREMTTRYPGIKRAALEIAHDNGGINRHRTEDQMLRELEQFIARQPNEILPDIDQWLSSLSRDELETVCCGEQNEQSAILRGAPMFTDKLLNDYFDEVC